MARLFLDAGESAQVPQGYDVFGSSGSETVSFTDNFTGGTIDANVEVVEFTGDLSDYTFRAAGSGFEVLFNGEVMLTIASMNQDMSVKFADGSATASMTGVGAFTLGGVEVPAEAGAIAADDMGDEFDTEDQSSTGGDGDNTQTGDFTLTASADSVNEAGTVTYTVTLDEAATEDTTVTFLLAPGSTTAANQGTSTTNLNDFSSGSFGSVTKTIAAGSTTATFEVTPLNDSLTELTETFTVSATIGNATNSVTTEVEDGTGGQTFTLTTGADSASGTLIDGSRYLSAGVYVQTLNNADSLTGTSNTDDRLYAELTGSSTTTPTSVSGVEVIDVTNTNSGTAGASELSLVNSDASVTTVKSSNNANNMTVSNLQSAPTAFEVSTTASNFTASVLASKLSGTADTASLTLSNVTAGTITLAPTSAGSGYETLNVVSSGTTKNGTTTDLQIDDGVGTSLATVNFSGSNALDVDFGMNTVTKVDASTMTGKLDVDFANGNAKNVSVLGGTADDTIEVGATAGDYSSNDTINGGDGTDSLWMINADATNATATQSNVTGIEYIGLVDGISGAVSATKFGATGVKFGAASAGASTIAFSAGTNNLDYGAFAVTHTLGVTTAGTATSDIVNLTLGSSSTASGNNSGALTFNGVETLNILSQGGANTLTSLTLTSTAAHEKVVVTGSQTLTLNTTLVADELDASGMTGSAAIVMGTNAATAAQTITTTANADTIYGSTAGDIINGGAGDDTIYNRAAGNATSGDLLTGGAGYDKFALYGDVAGGVTTGGAIYSSGSRILDFSVGSTATTTDILQLSAIIGNYSGGNAFAAGVGAAAAGSTTVQTVAMNAAATGYVTGTDLIKLTTGVATTGDTLQASFNEAIGTATVTGLGANTDIFASFYDTTNSRMVVVLVDSAANTTTAVETGDTVTLVGTIDMSAADYANFNQNNLQIIA